VVLGVLERCLSNPEQHQVRAWACDPDDIAWVSSRRDPSRGGEVRGKLAERGTQSNIVEQRRSEPTSQAAQLLADAGRQKAGRASGEGSSSGSPRNLTQTLQQPGDVSQSLNRILVNSVGQLTALGLDLPEEPLRPQIASAIFRSFTEEPPRGGYPDHLLSADSMETIPWLAA
jgi:hypothetical protein